MENEIRLTEIEAIQLTIQHGFNGSELESAKFKKNGSLDGQRDKVTGEFLNSGMRTFLNKLNQIYENVKVEGKGKKKIYTLSGLKSDIQVINDFRSVAQQDDDDYVMAKHLCNHLLNGLNGRTFTHNRWTIEIGGLNPKVIDDDLIYNCFDELYYGADLSNIHHAVTEYIKQRNEGVASLSIKILKQKGLITSQEVYQAVTIDEKFITIENDTYLEWKKQERAIVEEYGFKMSNYLSHIHKEENKEFKDELDNFKDESGIKMMYIAYNLQIKKQQQPFDVSYTDFQTTYNRKMINLITELCDCKRELQNFFSARFRKFNYLTVLKACNWTIHIDDELIKEFEPIPFAIDIMINERKNHKGMEKVVERWRKSNDSFGELIEGNITLNEFDKKHVIAGNDNEIKVDSVSQVTYAIDNILADVKIPEYEYLPFDYKETNKYSFDSTVHNNKELANAVDRIKMANN